MYALLMSLVLAGSSPSSQLQQAHHEVEITRSHWDAAVAGDHPVEAGKWARRHFVAMQKLKAERARLDRIARR
jgi:hypothetical protein